MLLGLTLVPLLASNATGHSPIDSQDPLRITIRMVNPGVAPGKTLAQAEHIAGHILGRAGVEVDWCNVAGRDNPCPPDGDPMDLRVQILNTRPTGNFGDVTGFAVLLPLWKDGDCYAGISYPMVERMSKGMDTDVSNVLGTTLAHEIGHLLLGAKSHSQTGIMCPRLKPGQLVMASRGDLLFTAEQAGRIRARLTRRLVANR